MNNKKILIIIFSLTLGSKIISFVREMLIAAFYGTSSISDVYIVALSIPMLLFSGIGTAILTGYIPIGNEIKQKFGKKYENDFVYNLTQKVSLILSVFAILGILFAEKLVRIFFDNEEYIKLAVELTRINFPVIIFLVVGNIFIGYLQSNDSLVHPSISLFLYNIIFLIGVLGNSFFGIKGVTFMNVVACGVQLGYLIFVSKKSGLKAEKGEKNISENYIKKIMSISIPIFIGGFSQQLNNFIDKFLGANIGAGVVSAFSYSNKLVLLLYGFITIGINNVLYPRVSKLDKKNIKIEIEKYIIIILALIVPIVIIMFVFSEELVTLVFGRGNFDIQAIKITSNILSWYSIAILFWSIRDLIMKLLYLNNDSKTSMINTFIASGINVVLSLFLCDIYSYRGIAIATTISSIYGVIGLIFILKYKHAIKFTFEFYRDLIIIFLVGSISLAIMIKVQFILKLIIFIVLIIISVIIIFNKIKSEVKI